jgi:hypothetical protein
MAESGGVKAIRGADAETPVEGTAPESALDPTAAAVAADPLKAWGDVLLKQGHPKAAVAKYDEALKYAPYWKQLKEARAAAAI